jgi:DNA repair exonuclease SbcCD ATPase subunit
MRRVFSVGDTPLEVLFSTDNGITYIKGRNLDVSEKSSNGAGKSTIAEGLFFGIKGKTLRNLTSENILHNGSDGGGIVEVEFDNVKVIRTVKPNGVKLFVDGQEQTTASMIETKKLIDNIVGLNFETLANILIFGQHNIVSFLEAGEPERREIVENLMNLREYNLFEERVRTNVRELKTQAKVLAESHSIHVKHSEEQAVVLQQQQTLLQTHFSQLDAEIATIEARLASVPDTESLRRAWAEYDAAIEARKALEAELTVANEARNAATVAYNDAVAAMQKDAMKKTPLVEAVNAIKTEIGNVDQQYRDTKDNVITPILTRGKGVAEQLQQLHADRDQKTRAVVPTENWALTIRSLNGQIELLDAEIKTITDSREQCPTCGGTINAAQSAKIIEDRNTAKAAVQKQLEAARQAQQDDDARIVAELKQIEGDFTKGLEPLTIQREELLMQYQIENSKVEQEYGAAKATLETRLIEASTALSNFDGDLAKRHQPIIDKKQRAKSTQTKKCTELTEKVETYALPPKPSISLEDLGRFHAQAESDRKALAEKQAAKLQNAYTDMIVTLEKSIEGIQQKITETEATIKENERQLPYMEFWLAAFGKEGIKSFIVDQIIPTLNEQIEYWMQIMYQGSISVQFDKYLNVTMYNNSSKNQMVFGQGSGGERRRIDIAIMLAFRQIMKLTTGKDPNIVFFDEVAENLDEEGVYRLYDALLDISKSSHVYVITHNPLLTSLLERHHKMELVKKDGATLLAA